MINIDTNDIFAHAAKPSAEELRAQAMKFLYDNQECYVAQWILQNPFANPEHYALKFVYNDASMLGYSVTMEKLPNV